MNRTDSFVNKLIRSEMAEGGGIVVKEWIERLRQDGWLLRQD